MKKKKMILSVVTALLVVGFLVANVLYMNSVMQPVEIVGFAKNIVAEEGIAISDTDIVMVEISKKDLTSSMITKKEDILGKYLKSNGYKDQYVLKEMIVDEDIYNPFKDIDFSMYRKIPVEVDNITGIGGDLKPGQTVDLFFVDNSENKDEDYAVTEFTYAKRFMSDVVVYKVLTGDGTPYTEKTQPKTVEEELAGEQIDSNVGTEEKLGLVVILLTPEQAEEFFARQSKGLIRLAGNFDDTFDYETEGYVIGNYNEVFTGEFDVETDANTSSGINSNTQENSTTETPSLGEATGNDAEKGSGN